VSLDLSSPFPPNIKSLCPIVFEICPIQKTADSAKKKKKKFEKVEKKLNRS
jgi:hypothetical protein